MQETLLEAEPQEVSFDDIFGSTMPAGLKPLSESNPEDNWRDPKRASTPGQGADLYRPAFRYIRRRWPDGYFWKAETIELGRYEKDVGRELIKKDMLGFADLIGVSDGKFLAFQITTPGKFQAHLVKYTSASETIGSGKVPIGKHLRSFLRSGGEFWMYGFEKVGREYQPTKVMRVTEAEMDACCARARGRETA